MSAMRKLITTETKLFLREPPAVFWALVFPTVLLAALGGLFPGFRDADPALGGLRLIDLYVPIVLGMALATIGVMGLPVVLVTYRQFGVLRRMSVTPVGPVRLLGAQLVVHLGVAVSATVLAIGVGVVAFQVPFPKGPIVFGLVLLLAAASVFAIGLLIAAVAPTVSAGQGIGALVYFPLLFFAGVYFPRETMPAGLRAVSDLTPTGAAVQALNDAWAGVMPDASTLLVMAVYAVGAGLLSVLLLRWE